MLKVLGNRGIFILTVQEGKKPDWMFHLKRIMHFLNTCRFKNKNIVGRTLKMIVSISKYCCQAIYFLELFSLFLRSCKKYEYRYVYKNSRIYFLIVFFHTGKNITYIGGKKKTYGL